MGSYGPTGSGTQATAAPGDIAWGTPSLAATSNDSGTTATNANDGVSYTSQRLTLTNFGFAVTASDTITNINAVVRRRKSGMNSGSVTDLVVQLRNTGGLIGSNKATGTAWTIGSFTDDAYNHDMTGSGWNVSLTGADVNDSGFGIVVSATLANSGVPPASALIAEVDYVSLTLTTASGATFIGHGCIC